MVGIVTGVGLGLERSSASLLGANGHLGTTAVGNGEDQVSVNAATGNLIDLRLDQILTGIGPNNVIADAYNSLGSYSPGLGAGSSWLGSYQRSVGGLTGTVNTSGSAITHIAADGSKVVYTYQSSSGLYLGNEDGGAYDTLSYSSGTSLWTFTDGKSQLVEVYDGANGGRIVSSTDTNGNAIVYHYTGSLLMSITTADTGGHQDTTTLNYNGSNQLTSVATSYWDIQSNTQLSMTLVSYAYDGQGRLSTVTTDLTPTNTTDNSTYVTTYTYTSTTSNLIQTITQSDGSSLTIAYDTSNRVSQLTQLAASGVNRVTNFNYSVAGQTTVTDPLLNQTTLYYDSNGELTKIVAPVPVSGGSAPTSLFAYDAMGDVTSVTAPDGTAVTYTYDTNGNRLSMVDALGDKTAWTYDARNQALTKTQYLFAGPPAPVAASSSETVAENSSSDPIALSLSGGLASSISVIGAQNPTHGTLGFGSGATVTYTPNAGYLGSDSFSYTAVNSSGASSVATVSLTVAVPTSGALPVPVATNSSQTVMAGSSNDAIALMLSGGVASSVSPSGALHGTVNHTGATITYTPNAGYTGSDSFTYTATNASGTSSTATVTLTVAVASSGAPPAPVAANSSQTVFANSSNDAIALTLSGGLASSVSPSGASHGTVGHSGGTITYTPNAGYLGTDSFTYTASNLGGTSSTATVSLTVASPTTGSQGVPVTTSSSQTIQANSSNTPVGLLLSGGTPTSVTITTNPAYGSVSVSGTTVTYTPTAGYTGTDSFGYTASNGSGTSSVAGVNLTVAVAPTGAEINPTAWSASSNAGGYTGLTNAGMSDGVFSGTSSSWDTAYDSTAFIQADLGTAQPIGYIRIADMPYTYCGNQIGPSLLNGANVQYSTDGTTWTTLTQVSGVTDGTYTQINFGGVSARYVRLEENPGPLFGLAVGDFMIFSQPLAAPTANNVSASVNTGSSSDPIPLNTGGIVTGVNPTSGPSHGSVSFSGTTAYYTPTAGYAGADSFGYTVSNGAGTSSAATANITVNAPIAAPTATAISAVVSYQTATGILLNTTGQVTTVSASQGSHGSTSVAGTTVTYTPAAGYVGSDSFTYSVSNAAGPSSTVTASITVNAPVAAPTAAAVTAATQYQTATAIVLNATGQVTSVGKTDPSHGTLSNITATSITYTPSNNYVGSDSFTYTVTNASGTSSAATVNITVNAPLAAPVANAVTAVVANSSSNNPIVLNVTGVPTIVHVGTPATNGTATATGTSITYTPNAGYSGTDTFTYTATNASGLSAPATVTINVNAASAATNPLTTWYAYDGHENLAYSVTPDGEVTQYQYNSYGQQTSVIQYTNDLYSGANGVNAPPAPTTGASSQTVAQNSSSNALSLNLSGGQATGISLVSGPAHGQVSVSLNANGALSVLYTPTAGYTGSDSFSYTASNAGGTSSVATASLTVSGSLGGTAPVANAVTAAVAYDFVKSPVALNITGTPTSVSVGTQATHGIATATGTSIVYTPTAGYSGSDSFTYTATNASGMSAAATVSITVNANATPNVLQLNAWSFGLTDLQNTKRTDTTYDFRGNIASVTSYGSDTSTGAGNTSATTEISQTTYVYSPSGQLLMSLPSAASSAYSYQGTQRLLPINPTGQVYVYDGLGRLTSTTDLTGATTTYAYNAALTTTTVAMANGLTKTLTYDLAGELISDSESGTGVTTATTLYKYDADGNLMMVTDPGGINSYHLYDNDGRKTADIPPLGYVTEYDYNADGQVAYTVQYATQLTFAQRASIRNASPSSPVALPSVRPAANSLDRWTFNIYDNAHRLVETIDPAGAVVTLSYDGASNVVAKTAYANLLSAGTLSGFDTTPPTTPTLPTASPGLDRTTRYFYDVDNRQIGELDANGYLTQTLYDDASQKVQTIAFATQASQSLWTAGTFAQLLASAGTNNGATGADIHTWYVYDERGFLRGVVDGNGNVTQYHYTPLGDVDQTITGQSLSVSSLLSSPPTLSTLTGLSTSGAAIDITNYTYNLNGQVLSKIQSLASGTATTTYTYNSVGQLTGETDDLGTSDARTTSATYNVLGEVTSRTSGVSGTTTTYAYDVAGRLMSATDPLGNRTIYYYDGDNRLFDKVDAAGDAIQYTYDAFSDVTGTTTYATAIPSSTLSTLPGGINSAAIVNALAALTGAATDHVDYNVTGTVADTIDLLGTQTTFAYNAFRELVSETDPLTSSVSTITTSAYNTLGELTGQTRDSGGLALTTGYQYDAFGRATLITDPNGTVRQTVYDQTGRTIQSIVDPGSSGHLALVTAYTYDTNGNVLTMTDAAGAVTHYAYTQFNRQITITTPLNIVTTIQRNLWGQTVSITDGSNRVTSYAYDADGNLTTTTNALSGVTTNAYDLDDRLSSVTDARGVVTSYTYDAASRVLTQVVDSGTGKLNLTTTYAYDTRNETVSVTDPLGVVTTIAYDLDGRKTQVVKDAGTSPHLNLTTSYTYDLGGRTVTLTEAVGSTAQRVTNYSYDNAGRLTSSVVDPGGNPHLALTTSYTYDKDGNVVAKTDAAGNKTRYVYDAAGRQIYAVDADGDVSQTSYDADGRIIAVRAFANMVAAATLSGWGTQITAAQVTGAVSTSSNDEVTNYVYDTNGRLVYQLDARLRVTEFDYDNSNGLIQKIDYFGSINSTSTYTVAYVAGQTLGLAGNPANRINRYVNDALGREVFCIDAAGTVTQYTYDAVGNKLKTYIFGTTYAATGVPSLATMQSWATTNANTGTNSTDRVTRALYDNAGRAIYTVSGEDTYLNQGYVTLFAYNADGSVTSQTRYAALYNVTDSTTISGLATTIGSPSGSQVWSYGYDSAGRLYFTNDPTGVQTALTLDALGRTTDSVIAYGTSDAADTHYVYDVAGRVTSVTQAYGASEAATTGYTYDGVGRVLVVTDPRGNTTTYTYDAVGRVKTKTVQLDTSTNAVTTDTYDAFGNLLTTTDPNGNVGYYFYDQLNRQTLFIDPMGYITATTYTIGNEVASVTHYVTADTGTITPGAPPTPTPNSQDATTTFTRDLDGRVTQVTDALGNYEQYTLNAFGDRVSVRNKLGGVTTNTYDHRGLLLAEVLPISSVRSDSTTEAGSVTNKYTYDARGNRTQMIEAYGLTEARTTNYAYDLLDRLVTTTGDNVTVVASDLQTTSSVTPTTTNVYDRRGNVIETTDASGAHVFSYYNHLSYKIAQVDQNNYVTTFAVDGNGNVLTQTRYATAFVGTVTTSSIPAVSSTASDIITNYTYDKNNRLLTATLPQLQLGAYSNGAYGTVTRDVVTQTNVYDKDGNVIQQTDGRGLSVFTYYDKAGRKIAQVDQANYITTWSLDQNGNVLTETRYATAYVGTVTTASIPTVSSNANDRITTFTYDRNGNRLTETRTGVTAYTVSTTNGALSAASTSATVTYVYNGLGEVLSKTEATGEQTVYSYDAEGRQTEVAAPAFTDWNGISVQPATIEFYDGLNNLTRSEQRDVGHSTVTPRATLYTYGTAANGYVGRLVSMTDASGFVRNYGYDAMGRTVKVSYARTLSNGTQVTEAQAYRYDTGGRTIFQSVATQNGTTWTFGDQVAMSYDMAGNVLSRSINGIVQQTYAYDSGGRMWRSTGDDGTAKLYLYNGGSLLTAVISSNGAALPSTYLWSSLTIAQALYLITNNGATTLDAGNAQANGMAVTITAYDNRGQATEVLQPQRQLSSTTTANIATYKTYNAFGEVASQTDANNNTTTFAYNTMGKVIQQTLPAVYWTNQNGVQSSTMVNPVLTTYYDLSGRLIGTSDANGNLNTRSLLAGTGYGGNDPLVLTEFHADTGKIANAYDAFVDLRKTTNAVGSVETFAYDAMDRLVTDTHPLRSGGTQLVDNYVYDGLGQRLKHTNNLLATAETTDYDVQGRVTKTVDFDTYATNYAYAWSTTSAGLGIGGWTKTTTNTAGLTESVTTDFFGRTLAKTDFGNNTFAYTFDLDGRLVQVNKNGLWNSTDTYYNTGLLATSNDARASWATRTTDVAEHTTTTSSTTTTMYSTFAYDANGNRTLETLGMDTSSMGSVQNETMIYDALNRVTKVTDTPTGQATLATINWQYDLNSNVRHRSTTYLGISATGTLATTSSSEDDWYLYDAMNRMTLSRGTLSGSTIGIGSTGTALTYNFDGTRATSVDASSAMDYYSYTADGYLSSATTGNFAGLTGAVSVATYVYDAMGRQTSSAEYNTSGTNVYSRSAVYDGDGNVTSDQVNDTRSDGLWVWSTTYSYTGAGGYYGGVVTSQTTTATKGGVGQPTNSTANTYVWGDMALLSTAVYTPNTGNPGTTYTTSYFYDGDNHLYQAVIADGSPRSDVYYENAAGNIFQADTTNGLLSENVQSFTILQGPIPGTNITGPHQLAFWLNGMQEGGVSNNGTEDVDFVASIAQQTTAPGTGLFRNGATSGTAYSDFDAAYTPVNGFEAPSQPSAYTVQAGDTLQSIAQSVWGDSSLWYVIADANGMTASSTLTAGTTLTIPDKVVTNANNSSTYRVYDPNQIIGDTSPTHPPKPHHNSCGVFGMILLAVIAIVVAAVVLPAALGAVGVTTGVGGATTTSALLSAASIPQAFAAGAIAGAAGSIVSQGVGLATGIQKKFSWAGVAEAAIGGGIGAGIGASNFFSGLDTSVGSFAAGAIRGAVGSVLTQGIEVATGLEKKFDWAGVAAAAVGGGVTNAISANAGALGLSGMGRTGVSFVSGMAGAIANAATRSLINGSDFGDNIIRAIPDAIGQTIGNAIAGNEDDPKSTTNVDHSADEEMQSYSIAPQTSGSPLAIGSVVPGLNIATDTAAASTKQMDNLDPQGKENWIETVVVTADKPSLEQEGEIDNKYLGFSMAGEPLALVRLFYGANDYLTALPGAFYNAGRNVGLELAQQAESVARDPVAYAERKAAWASFKGLDAMSSAEDMARAAQTPEGRQGLLNDSERVAKQAYTALSNASPNTLARWTVALVPFFIAPESGAEVALPEEAESGALGSEVAAAAAEGSADGSTDSTLSGDMAATNLESGSVRSLLEKSEEFGDSGASRNALLQRTPVSDLVAQTGTRSRGGLGIVGRVGIATVGAAGTIATLYVFGIRQDDDPHVILTHYTDAPGYEAIGETQKINVSTGSNAIYGTGVYLTDIAPHTASNLALAFSLRGSSSSDRYTHYYSLDVTDLVKQGRIVQPNPKEPHVFVYQTSNGHPLRITGRVVDQGPNEINWSE
jgi:YD repeat-containing protein